jgi:hypothetical protein
MSTRPVFAYAHKHATNNTCPYAYLAAESVAISSRQTHLILLLY